ncbi:glutaminase [Kiloniella laminariae]|uniref:Glutaminase n=1 Tax=Kiloniella laminariae TaxID=454162 RepID=A0ABT4LGR8_9PROT|nr:glutaminase [Kiloniella laminariae]MCZ4280295.1 glutaminase [Kiloniella laminariae]
MSNESIDYQGILEEILEEVQPFFGKGKNADYIPVLAEVPGDKFGMAVRTIDGREFSIGDAKESFSIQSISKLFTLMQVLGFSDCDIWSRVGREPSGTAFNSLVQLEYEKGIPRNPFINAGALVITDIINSRSADASRRIDDYYRLLSGNPQNRVDEVVATSERNHGFRNAALANLMCSFGNIHSPIPEVLEVYFRQCALTTSCIDLARAVLPLACAGYSSFAGQQILSAREAKRINALLLTCGLYDAVGSFAYRVGLPAKSGVGGGIVAVLPQHLTVAVWSPELDRYGNSLVGAQALELFTTKTGLSIF